MSIWIKICGNTSLEDALAAVEAGVPADRSSSVGWEAGVPADRSSSVGWEARADAVGFVFAPSPRRVTPAEVAAITPHLPPSVEKIGVFVDAALEEIVSTVQLCGLTGVQLHFDAEYDLPARLRERLGPEVRILRVIHFSAESAGQHTAQIAEYDQDPHVDAVLVDSRTATAIGGTGVAFAWAVARYSLFQNEKARMHLIAAGGLNPANVAEAISALRPWGVDAVSGVEAAPGRKDPAKVRAFIRRARSANPAS
jgi:phosphoribosylanthranilate isomerase